MDLEEMRWNYEGWLQLDKDIVSFVQGNEM